jgi:UPF0271 protein
VRIDLNADVGESFGAFTVGDDAGVLRWVTSANIAAGFHGGDPSVLRRTIKLAKSCGVAVGAHPGFPDLQGFGRRNLHLTPAEAEDIVLYQIAAVAGVAAAEGVQLQHVKAHGALYNLAAEGGGLADAIVKAVAAFDRSLVVLALAGSEMARAAERAGLRVAHEVFADRAYSGDGRLAPRGVAGAVLENVDEVTARAVRLATEHDVVTLDGAVLHLPADTICVHGDTPGAAPMAAAIRRALTGAGVEVRPLGAD